MKQVLFSDSRPQRKISFGHTLYGGGHPIGEVITFDSAAPPSVRYFHGDRQGSVMAVTTGSASLLSKYRYDP